MGKVAYAMNVSLDGFVETPERDLDWSSVDDELHAWFNDWEREADALVYGRRLYEVMADYWPTAESDPEATPVMLDFARIWNSKPKVVFSSTLTEVGPNCRLVRGDVGEEMARLRSEFDGILHIGGPTLAAEFIRRDLVDDYGLIVHPVFLGAGTPFFPPGVGPVRMRQTATRRFDSGVVYIGYARA